MISFKFRLIYGLRVFQTGLKIGKSDCIQMSETSELKPLDPTKGPTAGPWTPRRFTLRSLRPNFFLAPHFKKLSAGPEDYHFSVFQILR